MRIVLDTNVLVAGLLSATGPPGWILEAVLAGDVDLAFDMGIRQEYDEVLRRQELGLPAGRVAALLEVIDELVSRWSRRLDGLSACPTPTMRRVSPSPQWPEAWWSRATSGTFRSDTVEASRS